MLSAKSAEPSTYRTETIFSQPSESDHGTSCDLDHVDRSETMARCQWRADGFGNLGATDPRLAAQVGGIGVSGGSADQD